jgi:hypothetical protein
LIIAALGESTVLLLIEVLILRLVI